METRRKPTDLWKNMTHGSVVSGVNANWCAIHEDEGENIVETLTKSCERGVFGKKAAMSRGMRRSADETNKR